MERWMGCWDPVRAPCIVCVVVVRVPLLAKLSLCDLHRTLARSDVDEGHGGGDGDAAGAAAVLGCAGGVPAGGAGQLPRRLHGRLQRLARHVPALLWQRMLRRSRWVYLLLVNRCMCAFIFLSFFIHACNAIQLYIHTFRDHNLKYAGWIISQSRSACICCTSTTTSTGTRRGRRRVRAQAITGPWMNASQPASQAQQLT